VENDDLYQVARLGLVKAVDRFDPSTHNRFSTFATPTILGELRRHFRDNSRSVHVTRSVQELDQRAARGSRELSERLGRTPTTGELAAHLGVSEEQVAEVMALPKACRPVSLDGEIAKGEDRATSLDAFLGADDTAMTTAVDRVSVTHALRTLAEPLREVIRMRFFEDLSQREVGRRLGMTQMRVCRMERRALELMRAQFAVH
jgi:RNA polymerase sigma-B factor